MPVHAVRKGLDVPLAGAPEQVIHAARPVSAVGLKPRDALGLKPRLLVEPGSAVRLGQPVYADRQHPTVLYTAPASGTVTAVHRGDRRVIDSVVLAVAEDEQEPHTFESFSPSAGNDRSSVRALLHESGLWSAFRTRPFSRVPPPDAVPEAIFVTAVDSHPHAPDLRVVLGGRESDFALGLAVLEQLTEGRIHLCRAAGSTIGDDIRATSRSLRISDFAGPHPSGTAGYHIHVLEPVHRQKTVWHVGLQDVLRIGRLFATGTLDVTQVVSLAGPVVHAPRLIRTRLGACLSELVAGELSPGVSAAATRTISGSVLSGDRSDGGAHDFLGRHHQQVTIIAEGGARELFGWMAPGLTRFSLLPAFLSSLVRRPGRGAGAGGWALDTSLHGSRRAMVPIGVYERVMPMDLMPTHLLRAVSVGDLEWAEQLGVLELDEEDVALCTFVCPSKYDFGPALRRTLDAIIAEG